MKRFYSDQGIPENRGGSGGAATYVTAERMELMAFAQLSSRIGGAMMPLVSQTALSLWGAFLVQPPRIVDRTPPPNRPGADEPAGIWSISRWYRP